MTTTQSTPATSTPDAHAEERIDLLEALAKHRGLFRFTVQGLTDEQAALRPTVSELSLGGLIKHVAATEKEWAAFVVNGPRPAYETDWTSIDWSNPPAEVIAYQQQFSLADGETLESVLAGYDEAAAAVDELVRTVDLGARTPLPEAPWFEAGASWSNRRVFVHLVAEIAQHAGHADILRETIDGQKSMG